MLRSCFDLIACIRSTFGNGCILSRFFSFILTRLLNELFSTVMYLICATVMAPRLADVQCSVVERFRLKCKRFRQITRISCRFFVSQLSLPGPVGWYVADHQVQIFVTFCLWNWISLGTCDYVRFSKMDTSQSFFSLKPLVYYVSDWSGFCSWCCVWDRILANPGRTSWLVHSLFNKINILSLLSVKD